MNAVRYVYPMVIITPFFFHFCQANSRNIDKKGLKPFYKPGSEVQGVEPNPEGFFAQGYNHNQEFGLAPGFEENQ